MTTNGVFQKDSVRQKNLGRIVERTDLYTSKTSTQRRIKSEDSEVEIKYSPVIERTKHLGEFTYYAINTAINSSYSHDGARHPSKLMGIIIGNVKKIKESQYIQDFLEQCSRPFYAVSENYYVRENLRKGSIPFKYIRRKIADFGLKIFNNWIYIHKVLGHKGKEISIVKIRTMEYGANDDLKKRLQESGFDISGKPNDGTKKYVIPGRERMREIGLDEAPQIIWNIVIQGNMRVNGERPRPEEMWEEEIKLGLVTREEMERRSQHLPGLFAVRCAHPDLPAHEARRIYWQDKEKRPGSIDLYYFMRTCGNLITGKAKNR